MELGSKSGLCGLGPLVAVKQARITGHENLKTSRCLSNAFPKTGGRMGGEGARSGRKGPCVINPTCLKVRTKTRLQDLSVTRLPGA